MSEFSKKCSETILLCGEMYRGVFVELIHEDGKFLINMEGGDGANIYSEVLSPSTFSSAVDLLSVGVWEKFRVYCFKDRRAWEQNLIRIKRKGLLGERSSSESES